MVVDLWAPWCGPCRSLGPIIEQVIADTDGQVVLAKVNVDDNPERVAGVPGPGHPRGVRPGRPQVVNGFVGAQGQAEVRAFVQTLLPTDGGERGGTRSSTSGDETSLRRPSTSNRTTRLPIVALAELLVVDGRTDEQAGWRCRWPASPRPARPVGSRRSPAPASTSTTDEITQKLTALLDRVKGDDDARQEFVDLLDLLGPDDPRSTEFRRQLTARLY